MKLITIDFETFYSQEFGFSCLTTEAYVRGPQWETIGFSYKIDNGETRWVPKPYVTSVLASIDWSDAMVVAQNTAFDGAIMAWRYGIKPLLWVDIMGMSRGLFPHEMSHSLKSQAERAGIGVKGDEVNAAKGKRYADFTAHELARYGEYCNNDVELTYTLFMRYMNMEFPKQELKLLDLTLRMFIEPVLVLDAPQLVSHLEAVKEAKLTLLETVRDTMLADANPEYVHAVYTEGMEGIKRLLMSNDKFAAALASLGVEPPTKVSEKTKKIAWAFAKTDEAFKALGEHEDVRVQALVAARLGNKTTLEETRTERFIGMAGRGAFPVPLRYYGAHSGRWSGCLVADTQVLVYDPLQGVVEKEITEVLADDLVWDGVEFVLHEGVQFSGFQEVISWDNITGTEDHVVYTNAGEISLREAMQGAHRIQTPIGPSQDAVDSARRLANDHQE
jgi:hypothetical protein